MNDYIKLFIIGLLFIAGSAVESYADPYNNPYSYQNQQKQARAAESIARSYEQQVQQNFTPANQRNTNYSNGRYNGYVPPTYTPYVSPYSRYK